jgi:hypothetical protein
VERRIALLLVTAAVCAGVAALLRSSDHGGKNAQTRTTATTAGGATGTSTVLGATATGTVKPPAKPTTQPAPLPHPHQQPPATTPAPAGDVGSQTDAAARQELEAFLAVRPELEPYEETIWYSAHYSYSNVTPKGLAGLLWCVGFRVAACDRAADAAQR